MEYTEWVTREEKKNGGEKTTSESRSRDTRFILFDIDCMNIKRVDDYRGIFFQFIFVLFAGIDVSAFDSCVARNIFGTHAKFG